MLSDEAYWDVRYSGRSRSIASLPGMRERTVILYTFSKKFAMTGWRLGGAIGPEDLIARIATLNVNQESCTTHFIQWAGVEALTGDQSGAEEILRVLQERRDVAVDLLNEIPGVSCYRPEATFYLFPDVTGLMERKGSRPTTSCGARRWSRRASASAPACTSAARCPARSDATCASPIPASAPSSSGEASAGSRSGRSERRASGPRLLRTPFHAQHVAAGARMVDFGGWDMPVQYPTGIIAEHLATRGGAGLFDVSHMGRFVLRGPGSAPFLQHVLTNNAEALDLLQAQYTMVPTETGGAVDDAYLYRFVEGEYLLVVNASNRHKDWDHFHEHLSHFPDVEMTDETGEIAMVALQGKTSRDILGGLIESGALPEPLRNELSVATLRLPATTASWRRASPAPATPASRSPSSSSCRRTTGRPSGTRWSRRAPCPSGSAPATPCGSRPACLSTATSSARTRRAARSPSSAARWRRSPSASRRARATSSAGTRSSASRRPTRASCSATTRAWTDLPRLTRPVAVTGRGIAREGAPVHAEAAPTASAARPSSAG